MTIVIVSLGAIGIFAVEREQNANIKSLADALWWAVVTTTTVGYGDVSPVTGEGRLIAVGLMVVGIGFIGIFTATITSFFLQPAQTSEELETLEDRLKRIEGKIDILMRERDGAVTTPDARAR
jgi:voltage-gated potassium channel